jgi:RimJ/RimL family protein N-acetyltransferase
VGNAAAPAWGVELRPVAAADLPSLRRWRNSDAVRLQMVDTRLIAAPQQRRWFETQCKRPSQRHWTVWFAGQRAGYANLKGRADAPLPGQALAETGLYLGDTPARQQTHLALAAALAQLDQAFDLLGIESIETGVRHGNTAALRFNKLLGYVPLREDAEFSTLGLKPAAYRGARARLAGLLR